jgi:hypothetical protein
MMLSIATIRPPTTVNASLNRPAVAYGADAGHAWPAELGGRPAAQTVWALLSAFRLRP